MLRTIFGNVKEFGPHPLLCPRRVSRRGLCANKYTDLTLSTWRGMPSCIFQLTYVLNHQQDSNDKQLY